MNGKMARKVRKFVYGDSFSPRHRKYSEGRGPRVADDKRRRYQMIKKNWKEWRAIVNATP